MLNYMSPTDRSSDDASLASLEPFSLERREFVVGMIALAMTLRSSLARAQALMAPVRQAAPASATANLIDVELRDRDEGTSTLEPWPFAAERLEVRCEARRLAARYENEAAMRLAFEGAELVTLTFRLVAR